MSIIWRKNLYLYKKEANMIYVLFVYILQENQYVLFDGG